MALIPCSECGRQVSEKAVSCPGCGNPITGHTQSTRAPAREMPGDPADLTRGGRSYEALGFLIVAAGTILMIWAGYVESSPLPGVLIGLIGLLIFVIGRLR